MSAFRIGALSRLGRRRIKACFVRHACGKPRSLDYWGIWQCKTTRPIRRSTALDPARSRCDRGQHLSRGQPEGPLAARFRRPSAGPGAGCRGAHGRGPLLPFPACLFLVAGDPKVPILYEVDRSRDGKSFTSRRVVAIQHGRPIFTVGRRSRSRSRARASNRRRGRAAARDACRAKTNCARKMIDKVPEAYREHFLRPRPIELRPVDRADISRPRSVRRTRRYGCARPARCPTTWRCINACWPTPRT